MATWTAKDFREGLVKPPNFEYLAPRTQEEAFSALAQHGDRAKVLAGGQSLIPLLNFRLAQPEILVDINRVPQLDYVREVDGGLALGAMTRQHVVESSPVVRGRCPVLAEACHLIGHLPIRHRGTIGGNLAHADPASELPALMLALDAELGLSSKSDRRVLPAERFFTGVLQTALQPGELLTEVRIPGLPPRTGGAFVEVARRSGDYALVGVAALITLNDVGRCQRARVALCGVFPTPIRAREAEQMLLGEVVVGEVLAEAARRAVEATDPLSDVHASAAFRRKLAQYTARQAIELAAQRAEGA
jgi:aerobic carbon-monoxide dehydrogenase medium subunit